MSEMKIENIKDTRARYPFSVPDDYFDNLTARIMDNIPEKEEASKIVSIKATTKASKNRSWMTYLSIAASLVIIAVVSFKLFPTVASDVTLNDENKEMAILDEMMMEEEDVYYAMVDNYDIYNLISSEGDSEGLAE